MNHVTKWKDIEKRAIYFYYCLLIIVTDLFLLGDHYSLQGNENIIKCL